MLGSRTVCHISPMACDGAVPIAAAWHLADAAAPGLVGWRRSCTRNKTASRLTPQETPAIRKPACCMPHWLSAPPATPVTIVAAYIELHWIDCRRPVIPDG